MFSYSLRKIDKLLPSDQVHFLGMPADGYGHLVDLI